MNINATIFSIEAIAASVPAFAQALALHQAGKLAEAHAAYLALSDQPALAALCQHQMAVVAAQAGDVPQALDRVNRALALAPGQPMMLQTQATILEGAGRMPEALEVSMKLALALQTLGETAPAFDLYRRMISVDPLRYGAWANLGTGLAIAGDIQNAAVHLYQAATLAGRVLILASFIEGLGKRLAQAGLELRRPLPAGRPSGVLEIFEEVLTSLGKSLSDLGHADAAIDCHRMAIELRPAYQLAHWNLALALLSQGVFEEGWREYEWRWLREPTADPRRLLPLPRWQGGKPDGQRLMVSAEQGFGDTIQFAPMVKALSERAKHVVFQVHPSLERLLSHNLDDKRLQVVALPDDPNTVGVDSPLDAFVPQLSLPHFLGLKPDALPLLRKPLRAVPEDAARWAGRLGSDPRSSVGIVWAGRPEHSNDARRSLPEAQLRALLAVPGIRWVSLQIGARASEFAAAADGADVMADVKTFADTAALIESLDLVVAVDTSVAHLAAAMGKPVWLLLPFAPDWRWGNHGETSSWYPSLRLFRQPKLDDWPSVIERVTEELSAYALAEVAPES